MFRSAATSIRLKLYLLIPATVLAVGTAVGLGFYVHARYAIGGPVDEQLSVQKEFLSEVQPSIILLTQPVITLQEMESATNPTEIGQLVDRFREQEASYRNSRDRWLRELPPGEVRRLVEVDAHRPAE